MTVVIDETEYMPIADAAAELATTETKILMLLKRKALEGTLTDIGWMVTRGSVQRHEEHDSEPEQQLQCRTGCSSSKCGCH